MKTIIERYWLLVAELNDLVLEINGEYDYRAHLRTAKPSDLMPEGYFEKKNRIQSFVKDVARLELEISLTNRSN